MPMAPAAAALLRWRRSTACGDSCPFWNIEKAKRFENAGKPHVFLANHLIYQAIRKCQKHQGSLQRRVGGSQTLRGIFYVAIHHGKKPTSDCCFAAGIITRITSASLATAATGEDMKPLRQRWQRAPKGTKGHQRAPNHHEISLNTMQIGFKMC